MCNCNCDRCKYCTENQSPQIDPYESDPDYQRYKRGEISKTDWWDIKGWGWYVCEPLGEINDDENLDQDTP